ncbi:LLM class flavin-dependent oxidoreductase [Streptomyces radicis]|uniref:LLM class flavin-dependent oxidoreductase n=2 Tax=Streptomyces radicis TaxID=1750517 RepID=A0A3A9WDQ3_9ACTN|nr:LLM class flavin-dependent oxidoreductase [Streptomyces radicis]RKN25172.1 LLM class flavin-dependent oxidoreductase [Streptomyces radicis]
MLLLRPGGYHRAAWRAPDSPVDRATTLAPYLQLARAAEDARFDAVFMADAVSLYADPWDHLDQPLEPLTVLSALAPLTEAIGLVATVSTTYYEPYNLARLLASLDHLSGGRAGWNVVTTADPRSAGNFGAAPHPDHAVRYRRAAEFVAVLRALWDSWDDDAAVVDRAAGELTRASRIHPADHHGAFFDVAGPLNVPRPPQGHPVLAHAGQSRDGLAVAPGYAEVLFAVQHDLDTARAFHADIGRRVAAAGRDPRELAVLPGLFAVVGGTEQEARRKAAELRELDGGSGALADELSALLGVDLSARAPDDLVHADEIAAPETLLGPQSWYGLLHRRLTERPTTVARLLDHHARVGRSGHLQLVGTPEQIADEIERWFTGRACDGFVLQPTTVPGSVTDFTTEVVPLLRRRGLFRNDYDGTTLRDHLGLPRPADRAGRGAAR